MAIVSVNNYGSGSRTKTGGLPTNPLSSVKPNTSNASKAKSFIDSRATAQNGLADTIRNSGALKSVSNVDTSKLGGYTPSGGGGTNANAILGATSMGDDIIAKIRGLLEEQTKASNASAKAWYDQLMNQIKGTSRADLDLSNRQYKMDERRYREMHGKDPNSGSGFSNMARITQNWRDRNNTIRMNEADNSATALANYQSALANNASTLAQGWSNYILPYYVNQANRNA